MSTKILANTRDFSIISIFRCIIGVSISRVLRVFSANTHELLQFCTCKIHDVIWENIHQYDTKNTCILSVILEYVSARYVDNVVPQTQPQMVKLR